VKPRSPIKVNLAARAANAEIRRRQTRKRLIEAGLAVLAEKGLTASIEDYAAAAGVSRGTFYNYFPTTGDLLGAIRRMIMRNAGVELAPALEGMADPAMRLATLSFHLIDFARRNPTQGWAGLHLERLQPSRRAGDTDPFDAVLSAGVAQKRFREVDVWAARTLVTGAVRMAIHDALTVDPPPGHAQAIVALILAALGLEPGEAEAVAAEAAARPGG